MAKRIARRESRAKKAQPLVKTRPHSLEVDGSQRLRRPNRTISVHCIPVVTANDIRPIARPLGPDYDFPAAPQLFECRTDGKERKLVGCESTKGGEHKRCQEPQSPTVFLVPDTFLAPLFP